MTTLELFSPKEIPAANLILTCYSGKNCNLIQRVAALYFRDGAKIADVTYGHGYFWDKIDTSRYKFYPSDILSGVDFRNLPYKNKTFDVVVLDPPYVHRGNSFKLGASYNNESVIGNAKTVLELYAAGIKEAARVLKPKGLLLIKCQDIIEGNQQKWTHILIYDLARDLNFTAEDLFVLHQDTLPLDRRKKGKNEKQIHARKNHSYLWVFQKKSRKRR